MSDTLIRSIASASDCNSIFQEIINPAYQLEKAKVKASADEKTESMFKLKNTIWNKIITSKDFENFNDQEYFRWIEIYKDTANDIEKNNPVSIEQKMALIEVLNARLIPTALGPERNISAEVKNLNAYKLRKLSSHLKTLDLSSKLIRDHLNDFAADLMLILKGPPVSLLDYFTANKTARMSERLMRTVQEDMLVMGLKGMTARIPEKDKLASLDHGQYLIKRIFQHKLWKFLALPYDLPWIARVKIPDELMEKILLDGLDAHNQELIEYLKGQNMIDHYERFRKVYKPLAFSIGFYFYYEKYSNKLSGKMNENQEEERKRLITDFTELGAQITAISDAPENPEEVVKMEQFQRLVKNYKTKYNEDPSEDEIEEMHVKIFGPSN